MPTYDWTRKLLKAWKLKRSRRKHRFSADSLVPQLSIKRLEERLVLNADAAPVEVLVVNAGDAGGDGQADIYQVQQEADYIHVSVNGQELYSAPVGSLSAIHVNGSADNDVLVADLLAGVDLVFDGGGGEDTLSIHGGEYDQVAYEFGDDSEGQIEAQSASGVAKVGFQGVEKIADSLNAAEREFSFEGRERHLTLSSPAESQGSSRLTVAAGSANSQSDLSVDFLNPTESLTLDTTRGDAGGNSDRADRVEVTGLGGDFNADFHVIGSANDVFELNGNIDLGSSDFTASTGSIVLNGGISSDHAEVKLNAHTAIEINEDATIENDGGQVNVAAPEITLRGTISAAAGFVELDSGDHGVTLVEGIIDVSDPNAGGHGGVVHLLGGSVQLVGTARIDASGYGAGGTVLVGGGRHGSDSEVHNAQGTFVGSDVVVKADAIFAGFGGTVVFWADKTTLFYGQATARGGAEGGDGGFIEISGKDSLSFSGWADAAAPAGSVGTVLFDPLNIFIRNAAGGNPADNLLLPDLSNLTAGLAGVFNLSETVLEALAAVSNVILEATNNITIDNLADNLLSLLVTGAGSLTITADSDGDGVGTFIMNTGDAISTAGGNITINGGNAGLNLGGLTSNGGDISLSSLGSVTLNAAVTTGGGNFSSSGVNFNAAGVAGGSVSTGGGDVLIDHTGTVTLPGNLAIDRINTANGNVIITADNMALTPNAAVGQAINAGTGSVTLQANTVARPISIGLEVAGSLSLIDGELDEVTAGNLTIGSSTAETITVGGPVAVTRSGDLRLLTGNNIAIGQAINLVANDLVLDAAGTVTQTAAITAGGLALQGAGTFTLNNVANNVATFAANTGGTISYTDANNLTIGTVEGLTGITTGDVITGISGSVTLTSVAGAITVAENIVTGQSTLADAAGATVAGSGNILLSAATGISGAGVLRTGNAQVDAATAGDVDTATSGNITLTVTNGDVGLSGANALTIGSATVLNNTADDTATTGNITITTANRLNNGTVGNALDVSFGLASGGTTNAAGLLSVTTDGGAGAAGEIRITSGESLILGLFNTANATAQNVAVTLAAGAALTVRTASNLDTDNVTLTTDDIDVQDAGGDGAAGITLQAGVITIQSTTAGRDIDLGNESAGLLSLSTAEIDELAATTLRVGSAAAGAIEITDAFAPANITNLVLRSGTTVTQTAGSTITVAGLGLDVTGNTVLGEDNDVDILAADNDGTILFQDVDDLTVGAVDTLTGITTSGDDVTLRLIGAVVGDDLAINEAVALGAGDFLLDVIGNVTQTAAITAAGLSLDVNGNTTLELTTNDVDTLAASTGGTISYTDADSLIIDTVDALTGITTTGDDVRLRVGNAAGENLAINAAVALGLGDLLLEVAGDVTQAAAITAAGLALDVNGTTTLDLNTNNVTTLAANTDDTISYTDADSLNIGTVTVLSQPALTGITTTGDDVRLVVGDAANENLAINGAVALGAGDLLLDVAGNVTQTAGITGAGLALLVDGTTTLELAANNVTTIAASTGGIISYTNSDGLTVGTVTVLAQPAVVGITTTNDDVRLNVGNAAGENLAINGAVNVGIADLLFDVAGNVTQTAALTATGLALDVNGTTTLELATNNVATIAAATGGSLSYTDADDLTVGTVTVLDGLASEATLTGIATSGDDVTLQLIAAAAVLTVPDSLVVNGINTAGGGNVTLIADNMTFGTAGAAVAVNAGTGIITVRPNTNARTISLGLENGVALSLTAAKLNELVATTLRVGSTVGADINIVAAIAPANITNLALRSDATVSQTAGSTITVSGLSLDVTNATALGENNDVDTLAANNDSSLFFRDIDGLTIGAVDTLTGIRTTDDDVRLIAGDDLTIDAAINLDDLLVNPPAAGNLLLDVAGNVTQTANAAATIRATGLALLVQGTTDLQRANNVATIAANTNGTINYVDTDDLAVGSVTVLGQAAVTGIQTSGDDVSLRLTGDNAVLTVPDALGVQGIGTTGGAVTLTADNMAFGTGIAAQQAIDAGSGLVTLQANRDSVAIELGNGAADAAGQLGLSDLELAEVRTSGGVTIGNATSDGGITIVGATDLATPANLSGGVLQLSQDAGNITFLGTLTSPLDTNLQSNGGDIVFSTAGAIAATNRIATLNAGGSINGHVGVLTNVTAATINLVAQDGGIGVADALEVFATTALNADTEVGNDGAIRINSIGDLPVGLVTAGSGNVTLHSTGDIDSVSSDVVADIRGATIDLTAVVGGIGNSAVLEVTATVALNANTTADNGNILIDSIGNLPLGLVTAGTGNVTLDALDSPLTGPVDGSITDVIAGEGAGNENIRANEVILNAVTGIGTTANELDTLITSLQATNTTSGGIFIEETNTLVIAGTGVRTLGGIVAGSEGNITVIVVAGDLTANGVITTAIGGDVRLTTLVGNLTVNQPVTSENESVVLSGGNAGLNVGLVRIFGNVDAGTQIIVSAGQNSINAIQIGLANTLATPSGTINGRLLANDGTRFTALDGSSSVTENSASTINVSISDMLASGVYGVAADFREFNEILTPLGAFPGGEPAGRIDSDIYQNGAAQLTHIFTSNPDGVGFDALIPVRITQLANGNIDLNIGTSDLLAFQQGIGTLGGNLGQMLDFDAVGGADRQIGIMTVVQVQVVNDTVPPPPLPPLVSQAPPALPPALTAAPAPLLTSINAEPFEQSSAGATSQPEERFYQLRIFSFDEATNEFVESTDERIDLSNADFEAITPFDPSKLPELFKRLPGDRYRIYLIEDGTERLMIEFVIEQVGDEGHPVEVPETSDTQGQAPMNLDDGNLQEQSADPSAAHPVLKPESIDGEEASFAERLGRASFVSSGGVLFGAAMLSKPAKQSRESQADRRMAAFRKRMRTKTREKVTTNSSDTF